MAIFRLDLQDSTVSDLPEMLEIVRSCYVSGIVLVPNPLADPTALTKLVSDPNCPQRFTSHPDPYYAGRGCVLRGYKIRNAGGDPTKAIIDCIYRGPPTGNPSGGTNLFTLTDTTHTITEQSYTTAGGQKVASIYYQKGFAGNAGQSPVAPYDSAIVAGKRRRALRGLRATGLLTAAQYNAIAALVGSVRGCINSVQWGGSTANSRGTWYFEGMTSKTQDFGTTFFVELPFLNDPLGFYDLFVFKQKSTGLPPVDIDTEQFLRNQGLPSVSGIIQANGLTLASMQFEANFGSIFNFAPAY